MGPKMQEISDLAKLIEEARKLGPMTDEQRREQAASFAFGQLALTREYADADHDKLSRLRKICRRAAGIVVCLDECEIHRDSMGRMIVAEGCPVHDKPREYVGAGNLSRTFDNEPPSR